MLALAQVDSSWAVVNAHGNQEHVALRNLWRQDFQAYCPIITKRVRHARRICDVTRPLFPGYLFVQIQSHDERWRPILSTYGVRSLVRFGDRPGLLENGFISSLKAREVGGVIAGSDRYWKIGEDIRVSGGAFDGVVAQIIDIDSKDRILVLMDILGRKAKVTVEAHAIEKV